MYYERVWVNPRLIWFEEVENLVFLNALRLIYVDERLNVGWVNFNLNAMGF